MTGYVKRFWLAYYADWSSFAVFDDETEALRYAVERSMQCSELKYGEDVKFQITEAFTAKALS